MRCGNTKLNIINILISLFLLISTSSAQDINYNDPFFLNSKFTIINVTNDPNTICTLPSIALDLNGVAHIAFWGTYDSTGAPDGVTTDVFYTNNKSGSFCKPQKVRPPSGDGWYSKDLHLAVDYEGYAHLAFRRAEDQIWGKSNDKIYYATNRSGEWITELVAGLSGGFVGPNSPFLGVDSLGIVHLIFESFGYYYTSKSFESKFQSPTEFMDSFSYYFFEVEPNGTLHLIDNNSWEIHYRKGEMGIFTNPITIPDVGENDDFPTITVDYKKNVHIAFKSDFFWVYYSNNLETDTFIPPIWVGSGKAPASVPMVKTYNNNVYILDDGGAFFKKKGAEFESSTLLTGGYSVTRRGGKYFFDIDKNGIAYFVYHKSEDIFCLSFSLDDIPPSQIKDLSISDITDSSLTLKWGATGDDSTSGIAHEYDIRYITYAPSSDTTEWWQGATKILNIPSPSTAGSQDSITINGLSSGINYYFAIKVCDEAENWSKLSNIVSGTTLSTRIISENFSPTNFYISQNYPNPFNSKTRFRYQLSFDCYVILKIYNMRGEEIITLVNENQNAGYYEIEWNAVGNVSGVYLYSFKADPYNNKSYEKLGEMFFLK